MLFVKNLILLNLLLVYSVFGNSPEEEQGVKYANKCEGNFDLNILFEIRK